MILRRYFVEPPKPTLSAGFRYGFLAFILIMLAVSVYGLITRPRGLFGDPYGNTMLFVFLLLNHVAFQFQLPPRLTVAARISAMVWGLFVMIYVFYLSRLLFPLPHH